MGLVNDFNAYRTKMNEKIMDSDSLIIKRIFNLDTNAYTEGKLDIKSAPGKGCILHMQLNTKF